MNREIGRYIDDFRKHSTPWARTTKSSKSNVTVHTLSRLVVHTHRDAKGLLPYFRLSGCTVNTYFSSL